MTVKIHKATLWRCRKICPRKVINLAMRFTSVCQHRHGSRERIYHMNRLIPIGFCQSIQIEWKKEGRWVHTSVIRSLNITQSLSGTIGNSPNPVSKWVFARAEICVTNLTLSDMKMAVRFLSVLSGATLFLLCSGRTDSFIIGVKCEIRPRRKALTDPVRSRISGH